MLKLDVLSRDEVERLIEGCDRLEVLDRDDSGVDVYDEETGKTIRYTHVDRLDIRSLVEFNSLEVDEDKFWRVFEDCVDVNSLMDVERIVFVSSEDELDELEAEYDYENSMDFEENMGIYWWDSSVVIVNAGLVYEMVDDHYFGYGEDRVRREYGIYLMETLVHELRHVLTMNPIVQGDLISLDEVEEEAVEMYGRRVASEVLVNHVDIDFVKGELL